MQNRIRPRSNLNTPAATEKETVTASGSAPQAIAAPARYEDPAAAIWRGYRREL